MNILPNGVVRAYLLTAICASLVTGCDTASRVVAPPSRVLTTAVADNDIEFAVYSHSDVFGHTANAAGSVKVTPATYDFAVRASGRVWVQRGHGIPNVTSRACSGTNQCGWNLIEDANCEAEEWDVQTTNDGTASRNGTNWQGHNQSQAHCAPDQQGTGGGQSCNTYIVERSDDGGSTWYEIGRFEECG